MTGHNVDPPEGDTAPAQYPWPWYAPAPNDVAAEEQVFRHSYRPSAGNGDIPTGAGLVAPRTDAVPPAPNGAAYEQADAPPYQPPQPEPPYQAPQPEPAYQPPQQAPWSTQLGLPADPDPLDPSGNAPPVVQQPRPEDLLVPDRPSVSEAPARWGWRGRIHRLTGGVIKPRPSTNELDDRQATVDIQRGFSRPMTVVVIQPKGGGGKTPTTIGLASALGSLRGGYVVGWDDNETRGTLAVRVTNTDRQRTTAWDLLGELPSFERTAARVGDLSYFVRPQGEAQFDALVSDDNPGNMAQIGEVEFHRIHAVLQRFYRMIVIDTGNNVRSPNWQAAVNAADVVVVVSTYQRDVGYSGSWVLDHLQQTGRESLARTAVTVLTAADPSTDRTVRDELLRHFGARTQSVVEIPYDPLIALGGPIRWTELAAATRRAWIQAGATVVRGLAECDIRR